MKINTIHNIDAKKGFELLEDQSINTIVTSPPYYGLRDYGHDDQLGLEPTPEQYVDNLVSIFRSLKPKLRDDGTLWLNLGDSYSSGGNGGNENSKTVAKSRIRGYKKPPQGLKPKDLIGIPWMVAFALRQPYEKHIIKNIEDRSYLAGLIDGEGCITILKTKSNHCDSYSYPPIVQVRMCDTEAIDLFAELLDVNRSDAELYQSHKNSNQRESYNVKAVSKKAMNLIADIYPYLKVKKKQAIVAYNHQLYRNKTNYQKRNEEQIKREIFCKTLINKLNQRENVEIPSWMIEPKIEVEQGWFLRQDLIWHKPNPMPESVKDRCTKSHEYIFLLSKSQKYYYDYEAIQEETKGNEHDKHSRTSRKRFPTDKINGIRNEGYYPMANKRSVWSVTTKPFSEAHFATYPEALIKDCILAGCPEGGIVLDPFIGAGTTALVSKKYGRNYIGFEINPDYINIAENRLMKELGIFYHHNM